MADEDGAPAEGRRDLLVVVRASECRLEIGRVSRGERSEEAGNRADGAGMAGGLARDLIEEGTPKIDWRRCWYCARTERRVTTWAREWRG